MERLVQSLERKRKRERKGTGEEVKLELAKTARVRKVAPSVVQREHMVTVLSKRITQSFRWDNNPSVYCLKEWSP